ncbi:MAG: cupin domain-containing protein [Phycisphaerales bacterium]|nr:cupin domain-containing protein [Phycisphaerales bacterium]
MPTDHPMALLDRRRLIGCHVMLSHVTLHAGFRVPPHAHENEQFAAVLSGHVRFTVGEGERVVDVRAGGVLHLPPGVRHGAEAIETSVVLDVFSPPSERTGVDAAPA